MFFSLSAVLLASLASVEAAPVARTAPRGAVYFISNGDNANHVISSSIAADGTLSFGHVTETGGQGQHANSTGFDALFSQDSVVVGGNTVFAVNTGSNTVSSLAIDAQDPTQLSVVGQPASSGGEFPVSLGVNGDTGDIYVLNGGAANGIAGFKFDAQNGLTAIDNSQRSIGVAQTTPPSGPPMTLTQVHFSLDNKFVLASVKGAPPPGPPGFVAVWDYDPSTGAVSQNFTAITAANGGALPFGFSTLPHNPSVLLVADPALGYQVLDINASLNSATQDASANSTLGSSAARVVAAGGTSASFPVQNQKENCWTSFSPSTGNFYLTDPGAGIMTEVTVNSATLESSIVKSTSVGPNNNMLDSQVATINGVDYLYTISPGTATVEVFALKGFGQSAHIQSFSYASGLVAAGLDPNSTNIMGMATWVSS